MKLRNGWTVGLVSGLVVMMRSSVLAGTCALCREALRSGGSAGLLKGFYWSIILLVTIPLIVLTVVVRYTWRSYRRVN